ncbi:winged helix-turn-helix transcriptional regulator [Croceibacterium xixiisoli]|uniref:winged helix-turn-helix transcriptional regulator n=1 Tax=Croceibacterium xixiisoli TaxID=1476466 RepID=UPI002E257335
MSAPRGDVFAANCPTRQLLDRIGDKWSVLILTLLGEETMRFNELKRRVDGVSQKMLSQTLRTLERDGLAFRTARPTVPVTVSYSITPLGRELLGAMQLLIDWAETRMADVSAAQRDYDRRLDMALT